MISNEEIEEAYRTSCVSTLDRPLILYAEGAKFGSKLQHLRTLEQAREIINYYGYTAVSELDRLIMKAKEEL